MHFDVCLSFVEHLIDLFTSLSNYHKEQNNKEGEYFHDKIVNEFIQ